MVPQGTRRRGQVGVGALQVVVAMAGQLWTGIVDKRERNGGHRAGSRTEGARGTTPVHERGNPVDDQAHRRQVIHKRG